MLNLDVFPTNYITARKNFREAALALGSRLKSFAIEEKGVGGEELTIDFALVGANEPKRIVIVSSGLHGIEGFFGSAVQFAWMREAVSNGKSQIQEDSGVLLIHAINPYGFSWRRRSNEDNIDLNRNFLQPDEVYKGAPVEYSLVNSFLNPESLPSPLDLFTINAFWYILRYGLPTLKQAIAGGQYDFANGLFFGGHDLAQSTRIIQFFLPQWIEPASQVLHLDFHTGLGRWADYKLFPRFHPQSFLFYKRVLKQFGISENLDTAPYKGQGLLGDWLLQKLIEKHYVYFNAEFGTYSGLEVLKNLRAENRYHLYSAKESSKSKYIKSQLLEMFCPESNKWRQQVLMKGLELIDKALEVTPEMCKQIT